MLPRSRTLRMAAAVCVLLFIGLWYSGTFRRLYLTYRVYYSSPGMSLIRIPISRKRENRHDVILSSYMNSGSRFTGRLLGFHSDAFYFYEPLWKFSIWDYYTPDDRCCSTTSGKCRRVSTEEVNQFQRSPNDKQTEPIVASIPSSATPCDLFLHVISSVYTCDLVHLQNVVQSRVQDSTPYSGPSWETYRSCVSQFNAKSECLRRLTAVCKKRKHRVIKVLRMSLGSFRPLLESNPRLKIIHLVRDPRAVIHSRMYSRHYPVYGYREDSSLEQSLCNKMTDDYHEALSLMSDFPARVKILYYEDLMDNLHVRLKQVYGFLDMDYDQIDVDDLAKVMTNLPPPEKGSSFLGDRKRNNAHWWRKYISKHDVTRVDSACKTVYSLYGYKIFRKESEIGDVSVSSYNVPNNLQWN